MFASYAYWHEQQRRSTLAERHPSTIVNIGGSHSRRSREIPPRLLRPITSRYAADDFSIKAVGYFI